MKMECIFKARWSIFKARRLLFMKTGKRSVKVEKRDSFEFWALCLKKNVAMQDLTPSRLLRSNNEQSPLHGAN